MPKNKDDTINSTKYYKSIEKGDEVTSIVDGLHKGRKSKVVGYVPFSPGEIKRLLVKTDTDITFQINQNNLVYWEDYISLRTLLNNDL
jgi:hypothetical protein